MADKPHLWRPSAALLTLKRRAELMARIRRFFFEHDVLEVETPVLAATTIPDPNIDSFSTRYTGPHANTEGLLYLQTSPEFAMKRLLAAGSGPIYQISKVFRQGEAGRWHNPEFTMLEWYRPGYDHHQLMDEVDALVRAVLHNGHVHLANSERLSYVEAFERYCGIDPLTITMHDLRACALDNDIRPSDSMPDDERDPWLDLIVSHLIGPRLGQRRLTFLTDFPVSQAALAQVNPDDTRVAQRFELYLNGVELANGFHELADVHEQTRRFQTDRHKRQLEGREIPPLDDYLLAALTHGLPACAGVAVGLDRLFALALGFSDLAEVLAFPIERA